MAGLFKRILLLSADLSVLLLALFAGIWLLEDAGAAGWPLLGGDAARLLGFGAVLWMVLGWQESLFRLEARDPWDVYFAAMRAVARTALLLALPLFLFRLELPPLGVMAGLGLALVLLPPLRAVLQGAWIGRSARVQRALLVGRRAGLAGFFELRHWERTSGALGTLGILLLDDPAADPDGALPLPVLGGLADLERVVEEQGVFQLLVCAPGLSQDELSQVLQRAVGRVPQLYVLPDVAVLDVAEVEIGRVGGQPVLLFNQGLRSPFNAALKRLVDIVGSLAGLLLLSPLLLGVYLAVKLSSPGPAIYRHTRIGKDREPIHLMKFRTMVTDSKEVLERLLASDPAARAEWDAFYKLKNDPRVTPVGGILRKLSLDELPQIVNVLKGDISLVGPRPLVEGEIDKFSVWQDNRNSVRPGLTGLWQVSGRNDVSYAERIQLDMYYIRNWSIWLDFRIILKTLTVLVSKDGAY